MAQKARKPRRARRPRRPRRRKKGGFITPSFGGDPRYQKKGTTRRVGRLVPRDGKRHHTAIFKRHKKRGGFLPLIPLIGGLAAMFMGGK